MAILKIITKEDDFLLKKSKPVTEINARIKTLLSDMLETMRKADGVGLAAPQVGVLRRVVVIETEPDKVYYLINPVITYSSGSQVGPEGCLSLPGEQGIVDRPSYVKVKALDIDGNEVEYEGTELLARAFCHEIDHLDGILYPTRAIRMIDPDADNGEDEDGDDDE